MDLVNVDQTVISGKFKHNDDGFKYFIGYKKDDTVRMLFYLFSNEWIHKICHS